MTSLYDILGVPIFSDRKTVVAAYRTLAKKENPDKGGDGEMFKIISQAHALLSDREKKKKYDRELTKRLRAENAPLTGVRRYHTLILTLPSLLREQGCHRSITIDGRRYGVKIPYGTKNGTVMCLPDLLPYGQVLVLEIRIVLPKGCEFRTARDKSLLFLSLHIPAESREVRFTWMKKEYAIPLPEPPHDRQVIILKNKGYVREDTGERDDLYVELRLNAKNN